MRKADDHTPVPSTASFSNGLFYLGGDSRGGTYILRMRVRKRLNTSLGRFKAGKIIPFVPGDYCYIGSALNDKGATCLAKRLVRHACRLGDNPPHSIRLTMLAEFPRRGLCDGDLEPTNPKKPKWNVDYLLDNPSVELVAVYIIRSPQRIEAEVGKWLEDDPMTVVFEPGLGANDIPGNTHLMRVEADEAWWQQLPSRLTERFLNGANY